MAAGRNILIVDDDSDFRAAISAVLEGAGYRVTAAASGSEGLARARAERPDLIILDIMMEHEWAGYEVNQQLKFGSGDTSAIPILMVSSVQTDPATLFSRSTEAGMITPDSYLTKPLDIPQFLARVRSLLG
jgi:CheY-like chemotaxis protein